MKIIQFIINLLKRCISDKFFESKKNKENIEDEITDDEIKNKEIMDSLGL